MSNTSHTISERWCSWRKCCHGTTFGWDTPQQRFPQRHPPCLGLQKRTLEATGWQHARSDANTDTARSAGSKITPVEMFRAGHLRLQCQHHAHKRTQHGSVQRLARRKQLHVLHASLHARMRQHDTRHACLPLLSVRVGTPLGPGVRSTNDNSGGAWVGGCSWYGPGLRLLGVGARAFTTSGCACAAQALLARAMLSPGTLSYLSVPGRVCCWN